MPLFPSPTVKSQLDAKAFPGCPGPIDINDPTEKKTIQFHGLYLGPGSGSTHRLFAVHHGARESIEAFDVDTKAQPAVADVGRMRHGARRMRSSTRWSRFADGGVAATNTPRPPAGQKPPNVRVGQVWEWHAATGWAPVPGTEGVSINGLEVSKDGKLLYVSSWGEQTMLRVERGVADPKRDVLHLPFRIDNLRMMPDGTLLGGRSRGQGALLVPRRDVARRSHRSPWSHERTLLLSEPYVAGLRRVDGCRAGGQGDLDRHEPRRPDRILPSSLTDARL